MTLPLLHHQQMSFLYSGWFLLRENPLQHLCRMKTKQKLHSPPGHAHAAEEHCTNTFTNWSCWHSSKQGFSGEFLFNCEKHSRTPPHWLSNAFRSFARLVILSFSCFVKIILSSSLSVWFWKFVVWRLKDKEEFKEHPAGAIFRKNCVKDDRRTKQFLESLQGKIFRESIKPES